ncbi:hypothetical protein E4T66_14130 [Sinimarinibacterium sp. CAU 1509]|uniref:hypothetical protein n=1 Tax=Sinimarinibacterium sp. CAU 1509 TaxID=2562283 RepID=UPI0010ABF1AF|nr:hypothetical protein [Sinimarinibacterium sp. CAU 1509]TJY59512.1 hypothetical protein E4T66_14130 [Sinimarinibacterium sp. CAU 1509]
MTPALIRPLMSCLSLAALGLSVAGCSQWQTAKPWLTGTLAEETSTLEGVRRTIRTGDIVTADQPLRIDTTLTLQQELTASTEQNGTAVSVRLQPGTYRLVSEADGARYFAAAESIPATRAGAALPAYGGIVVASDRPEPLAAYWLWSEVRNPLLAYVARIAYAPELPDAIAKQATVVGDEATATLSYAGVRDDTLLFIYRELAPGTTPDTEAGIEVELHCALEAECSYRAARFVVHAADPQHLDYSLVHAL